MFRLFPVPDADAPNKQLLMKGAVLFVGALVLLWLIVWLLPSSAPPPVSSDDAGTVAAQSTASATDYPLITPGRIFVVLLLAGGAGYALYLRRQSGGATGRSAPMQPLGRLSLTKSQHLKLVGCQDEVLLLGISPNDVTLLRTYPRTAFSESTADAFSDPPSAQQDASLSGFADVLRQYSDSGRHA